MPGPPGTGSYVEAPADGFTYGRQNVAWIKTINSAGDSMGGPLVLAGNPANPLEAAPKQYVDVRAAAHGQCFFSFASATQVKLSPLNGNSIRIGGVGYSIPSAGILASNASLAASTTYYVYLFNNTGTLTLEFSATGHAPAPQDGVEIKTGDYTRTLVGMVRTNASSQFVQDTTNGYAVLSYFNRKTRTILVGVGSNSTTSTTPVVLGSAPFSMLNWGDQAVSAVLLGQANHSVANGFGNILVGIDGVNVFASGNIIYGTAAMIAPISAGGWGQPTEGWHAYQVAAATASGSGTVALFNAFLNLMTRG